MNDNPLNPTDQPQPTASKQADAAVELIRSKVNRAYLSEPSASDEIAEVSHGRVLSKHQLYMQELSASGKSLAEIQTEWHHYYTMLTDADKHEVWQEFYAANQHTPYQKLFQKQHQISSRSLPAPEPTQHQTILANQPIEVPETPITAVVVADHAPIKPEQTPTPKHRPKLPKAMADNEAVAKLKHSIVNRVSAGGKLKLKHHFQSLLFGLATGAVVLIILLFSFFNEYIIAPFIQPSRTVSSTPIILGDASNLDASKPQVIIPKINVQIPLDFTVQTNNENAIENALEGGVVHYPSTVTPGQNGNAAFFGHSSNNIFNPGKYKFAFVLLHTLSTGDNFYITYNGKTFAYTVFAREVVPPSQVSVLTDTKGKTATAALITCDPPGTSNNRLVVWGEQVSPSISANTSSDQATPVATASNTPTQLANNGPTLWSRFLGVIEFWK